MRAINKRNNVVLVIGGGKTAKKFRCDGAIRQMLYVLNLHGVHTVGSCCGHGRYPLSIIYNAGLGEYYELMSGQRIMRTRNFYKKDKDGFFYVPEALDFFNAEE